VIEARTHGNDLLEDCLRIVGNSGGIALQRATLWAEGKIGGLIEDWCEWIVTGLGLKGPSEENQTMACESWRVERIRSSEFNKRKTRLWRTVLNK